MLLLPSSCEGCPFYQYKDHRDNGFVPDRVVPNSTVYFLAQNPGNNEIHGRQLIQRHGYNVEGYTTVEPQPLLGATGKVFNERFLPLAGLKRSEVSLGNAIRCRPGKALGLPKPDDLPSVTSTMKLETSKADIVKALKHCKEVHFNPPVTTRVVVTLGRHAMFTMTGITKDEDEYDDHKHKPSALENWRGYGVEVSDYRAQRSIDTSSYYPLRSERLVYITMHIAALFYGDNKRYYHAVLQDFHKLKLLLSGSWPKPLPTWSTVAPATWPDYAAFDTEYDTHANNQLLRWSLCDSSYNTYCIEYDGSTATTIPIRHGSTVLIQNALADIGHLSNIVDLSAIKLEDLMLAHSVLWSGEPHGLNYINSLYGAFNRYKHLSVADEQLYSALDAYEPMYMWQGYFIPEFKRDKQSWYVYKKYRLPLIHIIDKAQRAGVKVDTSRLHNVKTILTERILQYRQQAIDITGDEKFNLGGSKRLKEEIYG